MRDYLNPPKPDAWVDWVAVERFVNGRPVGRTLTRGERQEVVKMLLLRPGLTLEEIARRAGVSRSTVAYWRKVMRLRDEAS